VCFFYVQKHRLSSNNHNYDRAAVSDKIDAELACIACLYQPEKPFQAFFGKSVSGVGLVSIR
jgi:hypothetical protein